MNDVRYVPDREIGRIYHTFCQLHQVFIDPNHILRTPAVHCGCFRLNRETIRGLLLTWIDCCYITGYPFGFARFRFRWLIVSPKPHFYLCSTDNSVEPIPSVSYTNCLINVPVSYDSCLPAFVESTLDCTSPVDFDSSTLSFRVTVAVPLKLKGQWGVWGIPVLLQSYAKHVISISERQCDPRWVFTLIGESPKGMHHGKMERRSTFDYSS